MPPLRLVSLAATLSISLAKVALAQNNSTGSLGAGYHSAVDDDLDQAFIRPNATGSYRRPSSFPPNNTLIPAGDWIWNTAIIVKTDNQIAQEFWIDTPTLKGLKNRDIPFQVCVIAFEGLTRSTYSKGQDDAGDCLSTLNQDCVTALTRMASQSSGSTLDQCLNLMSRIRYHTPSECQPFGSWGNSWGTTIFGPSSDDDAAAAMGCNTDNNNTIQSLFGTGYSTLTSVSEFNETEYDEAIYRVVPILTTTISTQNEDGRGSSTPLESNLLCTRAKDIRAGSRVPAVLEATNSALGSKVTANKSSSAIRVREVAPGGVLALVLMVMLLSNAN